MQITKEYAAEGTDVILCLISHSLNEQKGR